MKPIQRILTCFTLLAPFGCGEDGPTVAPPERFERVFLEDFDGPAMTSPDPSVWSFDVGGGGWGNNQLEFNTPRVENARLDGSGNLEIVARRESFGRNNFTSARMLTNNKLEVQYGRIEARIKLPSGKGVWPAFWMLGAGFPEEVWPGVGEIDVMEFCGDEPRVVHGSLHGPGYSAGEALTSRYFGAVNEPGFNEGFNRYSIEWDPTRISWYVNDDLYQTITAGQVQSRGEWVFGGPFFLILNTAIGGTFCGNPDASTPFPQTMAVDYIRVERRILQQ
jgi:beta-glucanase (GH16 family)